MTSTNTAQGSAQYAPLLGTLTVIPWTGEASDGERNPPFLLAYSLGDGRDGAEAGAEAMRAVIDEVGLHTGAGLVDVGESPNVPITLLVQAGRAVLTMPYLKAQCAVPPEWEQDARATGGVYFIIATRPWPEGTPGKPVSEEALRAFVGDEAVLTGAAHCLVPVSSLRG
ncbi:hypothetical protein SSPS47_13320 [Streptomyces sp. S4.7]|uniref:DUF5949 family protein n=1 Tax=unclassified Streptomyces TaxID=2593676 RepID=UPI0013979F6A|nr:MULTISPECIES: DUF5949 family protein [unclassified Streptomyces]QHY96098.1 hypothetical protein SSPS47_13320 [Streptomyces sp. S4.7]